MVTGSTLNCFILVFCMLVMPATSNIFCQNKKLCENGDPHVCCEHATFDSCCQDPKLITMTEQHQELILRLSNEVRQEVASGKFHEFGPAKKMMHITWCPKVAFTATCNVKSCKFGHDLCRNTADHPYMGQNLFFHGHSKAYVPVEDVIRRAFAGWIDEYKLCNLRHITTGNVNPANGHFTQCIHGDTQLIGCALAHYIDNGHYTSLFACNYDVTNMGEVYSIGPEASSCPDGRHPEFPALCKGFRPNGPK